MAIQLLALSGRLRSGKDYVAETCGYKIMGFADPMYLIAQHYFGTSDKAAPGVRAFLQAVGQWGWGVASEVYAFTPERAAIIEQIRRYGCDIVAPAAPIFDGVDWSQFGRRQDFWVQIFLTRVRRELASFPDTRIAVVNVRFNHELEPLKAAGFEHYHVMCAEQTRRLRIEAAGGVYDEATDNDSSETFARDCDTYHPRRLVIWNDEECRMPGYCTGDFYRKPFLTLNEFRKLSSER